MTTNGCRSAVGLILGATLFVGCASSGSSPPISPPQPLQPETQTQLQSDVGAVTPTTGPFHIETWAYDSAAGEGKTAPASLVARYLTYAESTSDNKVLTDCHTQTLKCKALHIINANRIYPFWDPSDSLTNSSENWWLHKAGYTDFAHRLVATISPGESGNLLNESVPAVQTYWQSFVRKQYSAYDGLMADDMSPSLTEELYKTGVTTSQEIKTDAQVLAMRSAFSAKMTKANGTPFYIVQNGVNPNPYLPHGLSRIGNPANVHGLIAEGVPVSNGVISPWYPNLLDLMAQVNATSGFVVLLSYGSNSTTIARASDRYVHTATMWHGYSPGHEVSWEDLEGGTHFNVFPEEAIYPTQPVQSMSTGNTNLRVATNVWRREFRACYLRGTLWGHCAALVNTNGVAVAAQPIWLTQAYTNAITVVGGDVQNSAASVTLGAKSTSIPAKSAVLLYGK